jgi:drug/metabolite transporter (DMT)-like permease
VTARSELAAPLESPRSHPWMGIGLVVLAAAVFGTAPVAGKAAFEAGLSVGEMLPVRFLAAGLALLALARVVEGPAAVRRLLHWRTLVLGSIFSTQALCFFLSLRELPAAIAELLLFSYPALVALAGWAFFSERLTPRTVSAVALTLSGMLLIAGDVELTFNAGLVFVLISTLLFTTYLLATRHLARSLPPLTLSVATLIGGLPTLALFTTLAGSPPSLVTDPGDALLVVVLVAAPLIGIPCLLAGMVHTGVVRGAIVSACEPAFTVLMALVVLGEATPPVALLGAALLLAAVPLSADRTARAGSVPGP